MSANLAITFPGQGAAALPASDRLTPDNPIVGTSDALKYVMYRVDQVASTNTAVLLLGETGTGKELVARAIHQRSPRRNRNFVVVDCGALPGVADRERALRPRARRVHRRAHRAGRRFELANGGTVFLDEIGELPLELQPKLLRVLQEGQVDRLGSTRPTRIDVRIVAATNREPARRRAARTVPPRPLLPPQRLPHHHAGAARSPRRSARARPAPRAIGSAGNWRSRSSASRPGHSRRSNVTTGRATSASWRTSSSAPSSLAREGTLDLAGFIGEPLDIEEVPRQGGRLRPLVDVEGDYIRQVLHGAGWRIEGAAGAAQILGLRPSTLRARMNKLGIQRPAKVGRAEAEA